MPPDLPPDPTLTVARRDGGGALVISNARRVAEAFFAIDASSRPSLKDDATTPYDEWSASPENKANRIDSYDLRVLNSSMRARTKPDWWTAHIAQNELDWLAEVNPAWDLLEFSDEQWCACEGEAAVERLMLSVMRKGISVSVGTKMLHLKRPRLVPVLDDLVVQQLGGYISPQAKSPHAPDRCVSSWRMSVNRVASKQTSTRYVEFATTSLRRPSTKRGRSCAYLTPFCGPRILPR